MRIVLDLQAVQTESRFRGIGRYSLELAKAIVKNAVNHEIWILLSEQLVNVMPDIVIAFEGTLPKNRIILLSVPNEISWESANNQWRREAAQIIRDDFLNQIAPDIVHVASLFEGADKCAATSSIGHPQNRFRTAVTLYDLIPLLNPEQYLGAQWVRDWYMDKVESLKRADLLLAISEYARQEAMEHLSLNGDTVINIGASHTSNFHPTNLTDLARKVLLSRYAITKPFLLYSGAFDARKNLDRLVEAFVKLPVQLRSEHQLVFVGKTSDLDVLQFAALGKKYGLENQLILLGFVNDADLIDLLGCCALFVFPSLHEGFGLPALEAIACGAPTIGSNTTSVPEVIGLSDALFDPMSVDSITGKILRVLNDTEFKQRLVDHGKIQATKFSWDLTAKRTIEAFEKIVACSSPRIQVPENSATEQKSNHSELLQLIAAIRAPFLDEDLIRVAQCIATNRNFTDKLPKVSSLPKTLKWRLEGPFDSSYSLALLNRETAQSLSDMGHEVALHSTEGPGDFAPSEIFLRTNPKIAALHDRASILKSTDVDVCSRNLYPPRVADMQSALNLLHHYAWEESGFPPDWVQNFNATLHGITCLSEHVKKILIDNGVSVPLTVSGCGSDHWEKVAIDAEYKVKAKSFRFLHVSSCFPRKGADVLLDAYFSAFSAQDEVSLVIKTFSNPHNKIDEWLLAAKQGKKNHPHVIVINEDLADSQLKALYRSCDALVAPSLAEGFGLPMAEAMLMNIPVITTNWGGQLDFCTDENSWLVDFRFTAAKTHFELPGSVWAEPIQSSLEQKMLEVFHSNPQQRKEKASLARPILLNSFSWRAVSQRLVDSARAFASMRPHQSVRVGWVSSWNSKCGIAAYSSFLMDHVNDERFEFEIFGSKNDQLVSEDLPNVQRNWTDHSGDVTELIAALSISKLDAIVIQHNFGFISLTGLTQLIEFANRVDIPIVICFHSTKDTCLANIDVSLRSISSSLKSASRIMVHGLDDLNRLKDFGLIDNVVLIPHGVSSTVGIEKSIARQQLDISNNITVIASYGFLLPHKGLEQLIQAFRLIVDEKPDARLLMMNALYPNPISNDIFDKCNRLIKELHLKDQIVLDTTFHSDDVSILWLSAADLIVYPYQGTNESASGAVRQGLASHRPVAVTPLPIFSDVEEQVHTLPGETPSQIARGIKAIMSSPDACEKKSQMQEKWLREHSWENTSRRLAGLIEGLINHKSATAKLKNNNSNDLHQEHFL